MVIPLNACFLKTWIEFIWINHCDLLPKVKSVCVQVSENIIWIKVRPQTWYNKIDQCLRYNNLKRSNSNRYLYIKLKTIKSVPNLCKYLKIKKKFLYKLAYKNEIMG